MAYHGFIDRIEQVATLPVLVAYQKEQKTYLSSQSQIQVLALEDLSSLNQQYQTDFIHNRAFINTYPKTITLNNPNNLLDSNTTLNVVSSEDTLELEYSIQSNYIQVFTETSASEDGQGGGNGNNNQTLTEFWA